jgi:ATP-binding cassette subfamily B protein
MLAGAVAGVKAKLILLLSLYGRAINRRSAINLALALIVSFLAAALSAQAPIVLKSLVDRLAASDANASVAICGALSAVAVLAGAKLIGELRWLWLGHGEQAIDSRLSADAFERALGLSCETVREMGEGAFAARFAQGLDGARLLLQQGVVALAPAVFEVLAAIAVVAMHVPEGSALLILGGATLSGLAYHWSAWRAGPNAGRIAAARAEAGRQTFDAMTHIELIGIENAEAPMRARFEIALAGLRAAWLGHYRGRVFDLGLAHCVFALAFSVSFAQCAAATALGQMSLGELILAHAAFLQLARPLEALGLSLRDGAEFGARALDLAVLLQAPSDSPKTPRGALPCASSPVLKFHRVAYEASGRLVLRDVSFAIPRGAYVALVGPSGSGKSSLARLALGSIDSTRGEVRLNGVSIAEMEKRGPRSWIAAVLQEPSILDASIGFNAALGRPAPENEIAEALDKAGLHWRKRPGGLEARAGSRGAFLSGGERQRLALARLFLKGADLLILDEAFSALDAPSEHALLSRLRRERGSAALLVITHRLAHIADADIILLMEEGRLVDQGRHDELLGRSLLYRGLCAAGASPEEAPDDEKARA